MVKKKAEPEAEQPTPTTKLTIEHWPVAKLKPYKRNAKQHPPDQIAMIARLIEEHGFDVPIVCNKKGVIVKGHGRWMAAKQLGLETVPVIAKDFTPAQEAAARIADNRVGEFGWDFDALVGDVVAGLKDGLDVTLTGFTLKDLGLEASGSSLEEGASDDVWSPDLELEKNTEENSEPPDVVLKIISKAKVAARVREVIELALRDAGLEDIKLQ